MDFSRESLSVTELVEKATLLHNRLRVFEDAMSVVARLGKLIKRLSAAVQHLESHKKSAVEGAERLEVLSNSLALGGERLLKARELVQIAENAFAALEERLDLGSDNIGPRLSRLNDTVAEAERQILSPGPLSPQPVFKQRLEAIDQVNAQIDVLVREVGVRNPSPSMRNPMSVISRTSERHSHFADIEIRSGPVDEVGGALRWISPYKFYDPGNDIPEDERLPGNWFLDDDIFKAWASGRDWRLLVYGQIGHGKTILASSVAEYLRDRWTRGDPQQPVLSIYLKYKDHEAQKADRVLAMMLKQILMLRSTDTLPPYILTAWRESRSSNSRPDPAQILGFLRDELTQRSHTYLIVDGLDEITQDERTALLGRLTELKTYVRQSGKGTGSNSRLSLLLTSRSQEDTPPQILIGCNMCGTENCCIYYTCDADLAHGKGFNWCQDCAERNTECGEPPHRMYEPYEQVDYRLNIDSEVIEEYIEQLLRKAKNAGNRSRDGDFEEVGILQNSSALGTTPIGRLLGRINDSELEAKIVQDIATQSEGSFLLARYQWDHVKEATRRREIEMALRSLPSEMNKSYENALERIEKMQSPKLAKLGLTLLMWLSYSKRVMRYKELQHALSVDVDSFLSADPEMSEEQFKAQVFDEEDLIDMDTYRAATAGLITISETGDVSLTNQTAYTFFEDPQVRDRWFPNLGHREMALACIAYLLYTDAGTPCWGDDEESQLITRFTRFPFAQYACQYWGAHASAAQGEERVKKLTMSLLDHETMLSGVTQGASFCERAFATGWEVRKGASKIHVAAWFDLHSVVEEFVKSGEKVNQPDQTRRGWSPLIYACRGDSKVTVRLLLKLDAGINLADYEDTSPLRHAVECGSANAARELCRNDDLDVNRLEPDGRTSLMTACFLAEYEVIKSLSVAAGLDVNLLDTQGFSALTLGAVAESPAGVEQLLKLSNLDINLQGSQDRTALHWACYMGKLEVFRMLLRHNADVDTRDKGGFVALMLAITSGHLPILEEFNRHEPVSSKTGIGTNGWTLLHCASAYGQGAIVEWLLQHGAEVNAVDKEGQTALHLAARENREEIVRMLMTASADVGVHDKSEMTAAEVAIKEGWFATAKLIDPHVASKLARLSMSGLETMVLAKNGFAAPLQRRLSESQTPLHDTDNDGDTLLHLAVQHGHEDCVRVILEAGQGLDVANAVNEAGRTPVHVACRCGHVELVRLLLDHEPPPDVDLADGQGYTALGISINSNDFRTSIVLIAAGASMDEASHFTLPRELLRLAIEETNFRAVSRLIHHGVENTYLERKLAEEVGDKRIMALLNRHRTFGPMAGDDSSEDEKEASEKPS